MNFSTDKRWRAGAPDRIAIIGMAFDLPGGVSNQEDLWQMLCEKRSGIVEIPESRFSIKKYYDTDHQALAKSYTKWAGIVEGIDQFDPKFFGLAPREAASMDPQQRFLLQAAYRAVEDAHLSMAELEGQRTGVFVGVSQSDYKTIQERNESGEEKYAGTGYAMSIVANRVSHRMNLKGPSFAVDTACSSSLVALDQAVRNLRDARCDLALAGGVNVIAHPGAFVAFSKAGMLSPTGELSAFDRAANGYVRGEGVGVVLLKRLEEALQDGNHIHGVIEATAVNQDGQTGTMTAPSQAAQIDVINSLFEQSGVKPEMVGYAEAHGTGTPVGDPIEAGSIGQAIGRRLEDRPLILGSVKPNIGHLESAAGMGGLIKAVLSMQKGEVPPNYRFEEANPAIPLDALNLTVPKQVTEFPAYAGQRMAIVNSFGFGGTNGSALLSSPPGAPQVDPTVARHTAPEATAMPILVPLAAASLGALAKMAEALAAAVREGGLQHTALEKIAAAQAARPSQPAFRAAVLCRTQKELLAGLDALATQPPDEELPANVRRGQVKRDQKIVFTYSGQGNQSWNMARELLAHEPVFRDAMEEVDALFRHVTGWSILEEMAKDEAESRIDETWVTQPALFVVQYALFKLWAHWGVDPELVLGHSVGEVAASVNSGGVSLESAIRYLAKRSTIREQISHEGAMAAVGLPADDVEALLPGDGRIDIAGRNGPGATTISGDAEAVRSFVEEFEATYPDTFIRLLKIDGAWHSFQLDEAEDWLRREVGEIDWQPPQIDFLSTVSAKLETKLDLDYCWQNLRQTVRYMDAVEAAIDLGGTLFVEIGPHSTLKPLTMSTALERGATIDAVSSLSHKVSDLEHFPAIAAELFVLGVDLNWARLYGASDPALKLPGYPWETERTWKSSEEADRMLFQEADHPLLGYAEPGPHKAWRQEFTLNSPGFLKDHRYAGEVLFPAAGYLDLFLAAGRVIFPEQVIELEDVAFHSALFLPAQEHVQVRTYYSPERGRIEIFSRLRGGPEDWTLRASGFLRPVDVMLVAALNPDMHSGQKTSALDLATFYENINKHDGVAYGPAFQGIKDMQIVQRDGISSIALEEPFCAAAANYVAHPALLDSVLQTMVQDFWLSPETAGEEGLRYLPTGLRRLRCYKALPAEVLVHTHIDETADLSEGMGDLRVADRDGQVLMTISGLQAQEMPLSGPSDEAEAPPDIFVERFDPLLPEEMTASPAEGRWLLLGEDTKHTQSLIKALSEQGLEVSRLGHDTLGAHITDALADTLSQATEAETPYHGILFTWGAAEQTALSAKSDPLAIYDAVRGPVQNLIDLGMALEEVRSASQPPRVIVLTSGARCLKDETTSVEGLVSAPLVATLRTMASELPEIDFKSIDVAAQADLAEAAGAILATTKESEMAVRGGEIFAARLKLRQPEDLPRRVMQVGTDDKVNFTVTMKAPGVIDRLNLYEAPIADLAENEVRIKVAAVGLNFRDVMAVTGLLPEEAETEPAWQNLGLEVAGEITEVGAKVTDFQVGDRVMGMGRNCLQRYLVLPAAKLVRLYDELAFEKAVTVPSAFATAYHALHRVGRLAQGERVLVHVATGGVGLAAVQMAKAVGAEIFATAGSDRKRQILRDMGVDHVMNSRSLDYADEIMALTNGKGVDVILNSLPGAHIVKGLDLLAPYGRFLEIGKRDVYADSAVGMKTLRRNVSLHVIDLAAMGEERPDMMENLISAVMESLEAGDYEPLPATAFPVSQIREAFRYMSQAQHVGKVVVTFDEDHFAVLEDRQKPMRFRSDGSYLITGGTRGFSLALADWMSRQGAGRLILASRSGEVVQEDQSQVDTMIARGTEVIQRALDVTDAAAVSQAVQDLAADQDKPLVGVLHGAAVIKDTLVNMMTPDLLEEVLRPKVIGGWALHQAVQKLDHPLDFFVSFSSVAQAIGSLGQANYVAANMFLDALADYRAAQGEKGGTVDWGVIADAGFVARSEQLASYLETAGMAGLHTAEAEEAITLLLRSETARFCYARGDWKQVGRANAALGRTPRFQSLISGGAQDDSDVAKRLAGLTGEVLEKEIADFVALTLADVLKSDLSSTDLDAPMSEAGLDSLTSFELKMRLETDLGVTLAVSHFLKAPTINELSIVLAREFEAERTRREALAAGTEGDETQGGDELKRRVFTDRQVGLVAVSLGRFSSISTRLALEHRAVLNLLENVDSTQVQEALECLHKRHPLLGLVCKMGPANQPTLELEDKLQLVEGHLGDQEPLEVLKDPLVRIGRAGERLQVVMHQAAGDARALHHAVAELQEILLEGDKVGVLESDAPQALSDLAFVFETPTGMNNRAFWDHNLRRIPAPVAFARRGRALTPEWLGRDHGAVAIKQGRFTSPRTELDVLKALAATLCAATNRDEEVLVAYECEARRPNQQDEVAPFTVTVPLLVPEPVAADWRFRALERLLVQAPHHLGFDTFTAMEEFPCRFKRAGGQAHQITFARLPTLGEPPAGTAQDVRLEIACTEDGLDYRFIFDEEVVPEAQQMGIAEVFEAALAEGAPHDQTETALSKA